MNILVVGGDGLIGKAVSDYIVKTEEELGVIVTTTRRKTSVPCSTIAYLDLLKPEDFSIERKFHFAFLCAGINGFEACEGNRLSWRANVDGIIDIAMRLIEDQAFVVYPSTQAVEWSNSSYARQRAQVEAVLLATREAAIVRIGRVNAQNSWSCGRALMQTALMRKPGVYYWEDNNVRSDALRFVAKRS